MSRSQFYCNLFFYPLAMVTLFNLQSCRMRNESLDKTQTQVVGGTKANESQFPGIVYLPKLTCTATKISPQHFLTAKHCIENAGAQKATEMQFGTGLLTSSLTLQTLKIDHILLHKKSDLAIIKVNKDPLNWPWMDISRREARPRQDQVVMTGYGCFERPMYLPNPSVDFALASTRPTSPFGPSPEETSQPEITRPGLRYVFALISSIDKLNLSVTNDLIQKATQSLVPGLCPGDSGGPLLINYKGKWEIIGVNSTFHLGTGTSHFARIDKKMSPEDIGNWLATALK